MADEKRKDLEETVEILKRLDYRRLLIANGGARMLEIDQMKEDKALSAVQQ